MPFDQSTRNRLARFVGDSRALLTEEFTRQLQHNYGLDPTSGEVTDLARLTHLDDARRETARLLRETLAHYLAGHAKPTAKARRDSLERIAREQAFTVLNRLCALRMLEARGLLLESVGRGYQSKGFQLYSRLAGPALGETGEAYRSYLFSLFDEFAIDLPVLFDRFSPQGRLFPRPATLLRLLDEINQADIDPLWAEDETIGWIYQYFNTSDERRQMRAASQAPRNSRELAVRNQFFTPRYVVEFLTDNTLGRIWYEMTQGQTALTDRCRYLVRRPNEIFLSKGEQAPSDVILKPQAEESPDPSGIRPQGDTSDVILRSAATKNPGDDRDSSLRSASFRMTTAQPHPAQSEAEISKDVILSSEATKNPKTLRSAQGDTPDVILSDAGAKNLTGQAIENRQSEIENPVYIPYRPLKDPRDIKMLDPACGSMHFGLYAFDLFEQIYTEAWALESEHGPAALRRSPGLRPLTESYPDEAAFRRDIPRLIIEHNIHGIDIDPRAVQIAGLSLWLRAQKSWQGQGLNATGRPAIKKSNVVTAEPMPGDAALLDDFITRHLSRTPEEKLLGQLLRRVFEAMKLAGEAGALLKIEEEIAADIAEAKEKWHVRPTAKQASFLEETPQPEQAELGLDVSGITGEAFWGQAEERIYTALQQYAEQADNGHTLRRRLFAGDAARGFAFIDVHRQKYDVVLMNPPFGEPAKSTKSYVNQNYPLAKHDVAIALVEFWLNTSKTICLGAITTRTPLFNSSSLDWRKKTLMDNHTLLACLDLGGGVLDAMVETAAYVVDSRKSSRETVFIQLTTSPPEDKEITASISTNNLQQDVKDKVTYLRYVDELRSLPNSPLSYWLPTAVSKCFKEFPPLKESGAEAWVGLQTSRDERFLCLWWEVASTNTGWVPFAKGGEANPYLSDIHLVVNWANDGREMKAFHDHLNYIGKSTPGNGPRRDFPFYFVPGLTWVYRTDRFHVQPLPAGCITSTRGPGIYSDTRTTFLLAYLNSSIVDVMVKVLLGKHTQPQFDIDDVNAIPTPMTGDKDLETLGLNAWEIKYNLTQNLEEFRGYQKGFLYSDRFDGGLHEHFASSNHSRETAISRLNKLQKKIDDRAISILGISRETFLSVEDMLFQWDDFGITTEDELGFVHRCLSMGIGTTFGRWDIRYATGQKAPPELPDPFAPLPVCPPGMLKNSQGLPAAPADVPPDYPLRISWPGLLVDDPGHPEDIEARVREALRVIWPGNADAIEQEACQILGVSSLRDYFGNPNKFFDDHLKRYSKSRRYAPIYWPLSTPSGSYTLWLYYHRLDDQILYSAINDFVDPKLKHVGQQASALRQKANRSKTEEDDLTRLADLEAELHDFRAELLRLAASWRPNLNDGVQITAAPLWRLFQNRKWQKRLQKTWDQLEAGDYDWAHLAMSLWPARVAPKCVEDRSLAIAHGVEALFWVEEEGNWRPVQPVEQELAGQVERRQHPAHQTLRQHLADLSANAGRGLPAYQVWQHLREGDWDDTPVALALWPKRVAEKCWDQPFLAGQLNLKMPGKRTKTARKRFRKSLMKESTPELVEAVAAAFQDESAAFDAVWQALAAGERDAQPLALALWPQRVLDKCVGDVALALQHEVARYFWVQSPGSDSWRRRNPQAQEVRDEVARRKEVRG